MEYAWGYAAASAAPFPNTYQRAKTPARSNSATVTSKTKRARIPGHSRASSTSSRSQASHEIPRLHQQQGQPPPPHTIHHPAAAASAAAGGGLAASDTVLCHQQRVPAGVLDHQNKQLPLTPLLDAHDEYHDQYNDHYSAIGLAISPGLPNPAASSPPPTVFTPRTCSLPSSPKLPSFPHPGTLDKFFVDRRSPRQHRHAAMVPDPSPVMNVPFIRAESLSSSAATTLSSRTMISSEPGSSAAGASTASLARQPKPFIVRNGRTYLSDPTLPYPLPVDLAELHRQSLRTLLLFQLFGGPVCSPAFANKPPTRVLEVGCGSGFWSMMCHRYYARHGHSNISFTGIDIASIGAGASNAGGGLAAPRTSGSSTSTGDWRPDKDMKWQFVQHDMRRIPWPFPDDEFDLVMVKDMSLAISIGAQQTLMDEYLRVLRPGGTLEIWESDYTVRMLRPHVPEPSAASSSSSNPSSTGHNDDEEEHEAAASLGAYVMTANTPLSAPLNNFLVEYNAWLSKALEQRSLSAVPCTLVGPMLIQEAELTGVGSRRLAVPLSEVRWEREGVGGVVTKDGKSYIETKGKKGREPDASRKALTAGQAALRRTALLTVVQMVQSLEPVLREVSGKSQDEWDGWLGKMMSDLMKENGTSWGECLEIGAWWARKKKTA
ncbi:SAM binding domain-containing protein containing protein [Pleurostoma richardsiae]|uniref:SAM binding domain-containing protein containing protein n=1 Tax=Pleurostoma richardsiae TaxID=41990 RepID=A0AA38RDY0_9PEZI|nr:SAM binding domain-containing protein containing protein [Pleurostoma richardsiae]